MDVAYVYECITSSMYEYEPQTLVYRGNEDATD